MTTVETVAEGRTTSHETSIASSGSAATPYRAQASRLTTISPPLAMRSRCSPCRGEDADVGQWVAVDEQHVGLGAGASALRPRRWSANISWPRRRSRRGWAATRASRSLTSATSPPTLRRLSTCSSTAADTAPPAGSPPPAPSPGRGTQRGGRRGRGPAPRRTAYPRPGRRSGPRRRRTGRPRGHSRPVGADAAPHLTPELRHAHLEGVGRVRRQVLAPQVLDGRSTVTKRPAEQASAASKDLSLWPATVSDRPSTTTSNDPNRRSSTAASIDSQPHEKVRQCYPESLRTSAWRQHDGSGHGRRGGHNPLGGEAPTVLPH